MKPETYACVASGPSLCAADGLRLLQHAIPVIAVNSSWQRVPHCQHLYAADGSWWQANWLTVHCAATCWCGDPFTARRFGLQVLPSAFEQDFNSGQRAIELAIHLGARRVLLLGYDCSLQHGSHWHGDHAALLNPDQGEVERWQRQFAQLASQFPEVEVINCSRHSELRCFPRQTLERCLQGECDG